MVLCSSTSRADDSQGARNFYDVLEDVVGDFEFDLKNGEVTGLQNLSIRNIAVSETVPPSFKSHLEFLITERILHNSRSKVLQCLQCRAKRTTVNGDQVVITSPDTNPIELARIAKSVGIDHFLDIAFSYQSSGMVLSMHIADPETGSIIWSRSYNSETSRTGAQRRGADFSQTDKARRSDEYVAPIQFRAGLFYLFEPNYAGTSGCLAGSFKGVERYDNRKKEVGFEVLLLRNASSFASSSTSGAAVPDLYTGINLTAIFTHAWNLIGDEENFNKVRGSLNAGVGGTYSPGFLGGLLKVGYEWRLGKHFSIEATLGYRPSGNFAPSTGAAVSISGPRFGVGVGYAF